MSKAKQQSLFDVEKETDAIKQIVEILKPLPAEGRDRVLTYLDHGIRQLVDSARIFGAEEQ